MRKLLILTFFVLLSTPLVNFFLLGNAQAVEFRASSDTYVYPRHFEYGGGTFVPLYEYFDINMNDLGLPGLYVATSGWGRVDLTGDNNYFFNNDQYNGNFTTAYIGWRDKTRRFHIRLGRQQVVAGVATESIDGGLLDFRIWKGLGIEVFGGRNVVSRIIGDGADWSYGSRLYYKWLNYGTFSLSYLDSYENTNEKDRRHVGFDCYITPVWLMEAGAHVHYDLLAEEFFDWGGNLTFFPIDPLVINLFYNGIVPTAFFSKASIFSAFADLGDETRQESGFDVEYRILPPLSVLVDFKWQWFTAADDAYRYGGEIKYNFGKTGQNVVGIGAHYQDEVNLNFVSNSLVGQFNSGYVEIRAFSKYYILPRWYTSLDVMTHIYTDQIFGERDSTSISTGTGVRILENLEIGGSVTVSESPVYSGPEVSGLFRISYYFGLPWKK